MVYCSKCGTQNADDARMCVNCGSPLYGAAAENRPYWSHRHHDYESYGYHRRNGARGALIAGLILVFLGFSFLLAQVYGVNGLWWPMLLVLLGIFVILRLAWTRGRRQ